MSAPSPLIGPAPSQTQAPMTKATKPAGLSNPDSKMPPPSINVRGDGQRLSDDVNAASKVKVQMQSASNPSALVMTMPTIASAVLEGQQSSGFHPSVLAS